ncbi:MAG: nucleotidyltransferase domain-containing protein [Clostridia bacterium]|nr:nucleotidyltransferase domain-containing protein [Clostridia bacterium]
MTKYKFNKTIEQIAQQYGIVFFVYFGSYQTEYYNRDSDIDIAFVSYGEISSKDKLEMLEDLIKYHRKSEIDLIDLKKAEPILRREVALNGRVLYEEENGIFERYSLFYIKRFYELKPVIEEQLKQISQEIKELLEDG